MPLLTLNEMISKLKQIYSTHDDPPVNYIFANNYFFTDFQRTPARTTPSLATGSTREDVESRLMTLRYRWRAPLSGYGYAVKSIVDPQACLRMHNHYCWAVTPAYESRGYVEVVNETVAVNQHYKRCHLNQTECSSAIKAATFDVVTMARYRARLVANVVDQIRAIFNQSPSEFLRRITHKTEVGDKVSGTAKG